MRSLLIDRDWVVDRENPKAAVFERRLRGVRAQRTSWARLIGELEGLFRTQVGAGASVLEVGSGTGDALLELSAAGFNAVGIDFDPALCELGTDVANDFDLRCRFLPADACRIPFAAASFDAVYSRNFFEHVYDVDIALAEQTRVLRKGGVLLILDGNLMNPKLLFDLLVKYPIRSRGRYGGLKWLFNKTKVHDNLYGYLTRGRDEDVKTVGWWRRKIGNAPGLELLEAKTSGSYTHPTLPSLVHGFVGGCHIVARKA
jgi:SAM-dependent methyltransferase